MIILNENQALKDRMFRIPDNIMNHLNTVLSSYGNYKDADGYKRLSALVNKEYNARNNKKGQDDKSRITFSDLKRIHHDFSKMPQDNNNLEYILNGGSVMRDWVKNTLKTARNSVKNDLKKKKGENISKASTKVQKNPMKPIKTSTSTIYLKESRIEVYIRGVKQKDVKAAQRTHKNLTKMASFLNKTYNVDLDKNKMSQIIDLLHINSDSFEKYIDKEKTTSAKTYFIGDVIYALHNASQKDRPILKDILQQPKVKKINNKPKSDEEKHDEFMDSISRYDPSMKKDESVNNKNVILSENQVQKLIEYHAQTKLQFDGEPSKLNYEHFVDYIEDFGQEGSLPKSNYDVKTFIKTYINKLLETNIDDLIDDNLFDYNVIYEIISNDIKEYDFYKKDIYLQNLFESGEILDSISSFDDLYHELYQYIKKDNLDMLIKEACYSYITDELEDKDFYINGENPFIINDRGLVYIEREISIPQIFKRFKERGYENYYEYVKDYSLGIFWSYLPKHSKSYCYNNFSLGNTFIKIKGFIDPKDINWGDTIYKAVYNLNYENEIQVNENSPIEITEIIVSEMPNNDKTFVGKKLPLNYPIIFKA